MVGRYAAGRRGGSEYGTGKGNGSTGKINGYT